MIARARSGSAERLRATQGFGPPHKRATHLFILNEGNIHTFRQVFMDGRKHPAQPEGTWFGHSIGWWEGDTPVIDSVGFNG